MSKEKLYAVKNDDRYYWDFNSFGFWRRELPGCFATTSKERAKDVVHDKGGHVVTLIEEPEKVVLTKEQAEIVEEAHDSNYPATYICGRTDDDEALLMEAYVNGYTVAKEQKYNVKVPHTDDSYFYKVDDDFCNAGDSFSVNFNDDTSWFTESEIQHYGLQDYKRVKINTEDSNDN